MDDFKSELHYYLREKNWHKAITLCTDELKKGRDPYVNFWRSFAASQEGSLIEALRDVDPLQSNRDFQYSATVALIYYHNKYPSPDTAKITKLTEKQSSFESSLSLSDCLNTMRFYSYINDEENYSDMHDKLSSMESAGTDDDELIVKGWKGVLSTSPDSWKEAETLFQKHIKKNGMNNIDVLMGGLKCSERLKKYEEMLDVIQEIMKENNNFLPFHIERIKIYLIKNDYDSASEYINTKLSKLKNAELFKILALCNLVQDGDFRNACGNLNKMWESMLKEEPKNPDLYYKTAMLFSRTCDKNQDILKIVSTMIEKAIEFNPRNASYLIEKANLCLYNGDIDQATDLFTQCTEIDTNNKESAIGLVYCKIINGRYKEAQDDVKFLKEMLEMNQTKNAKLELLEALIRSNLGDTEEKVLELVKKALSIYIGMNKVLFPWNKFDIVINMEYDFLYDMAKVLLDFYDFNDQITNNNMNDTLKQVQKLLAILKSNKYFASAYLLNSKLQFILGDTASAMTIVDEVLMINAKDLEGLMMKIMICLQMKDFQKAKEIVNEALINSRQETKESAAFLILKSKCELGLNDTENSQKTLNDAITVFDQSLANSRSAKNSLFKVKKKDKLELLKLNIDILLKLGKTEEAQSYMNKLVVEFSDLGDELLMLHSDLALKTGDIKKAVNLLRKISEKDEKSFKASRIKLSHIYLHQVMDRRLYAWCYTDILDHYPSFENLKLTGQALMDIDSPDEAVEFYNKALKIKQEMGVMRDLGTALIKTHDYQMAIKYYIDTTKIDSKSINNQNVVNFWEMCDDYVDLMYKLATNQEGKDKNSPKTLKVKIEDFVSKLTPQMQQFNSEYQLKAIYGNFKYILAKLDKAIYLQDKKSNKNDIIKNLEQSLTFHNEVMKRLRELKNEDLLKKQKVKLSYTHFEKGQYYEFIDTKNDLCEKAYVEAITCNSENYEALYSLSNILMKKGQYNEAQKYVEMLLHEDDSNDDALALLISILNAKKSNDASIDQMKVMIDKQPNSFHLIEIYIDLIYRCGKIANAKDVLYKCERTLKYTYTPGLYYCKGLYYKYMGEINKALIEFSKAKTDENYGVKCLDQMLEIYINPDCDFLRIDLPIPWNVKSGKGLLTSSSTDLDIEAIQFLLRELKIRRDDDKTAVFEAYATIITENEQKIDQQCTKLQDILLKSKENLSVWIALIMMKLVLKLINEAKNDLKIMDNFTLNIKYYADYERGLLISAYIMMMTDNLKKAEEYLKKVILINIAQIKAYEYLAMIKEKQDSFQEACSYYEKAWDYANKNNANIGYKLAVCYINSKNHVKSLNICNEIKRKFPNYPIDELSDQAKNGLNS